MEQSWGAPRTKNQRVLWVWNLVLGIWFLVLGGLEANIEVGDGFQGIGLRSGDRRGDADGQRRPAVELESDAAGDIHPIGKTQHAVRRRVAMIERVVDVNLDCGRHGGDEAPEAYAIRLAAAVSKYKVSDAQIVEQESHVVG